MNVFRPFALSCAVLLAACGGPHRGRPSAASPPSHPAHAWEVQVAEISAGNDTAARGKAITTALERLGLTWRSEAFKASGHTGQNLISELPGPQGAPLLLLGAHYDRVSEGDGATDNASGAATVLHLAASFKARPLQRHRVHVAFWDLEEKRMKGSEAFVATPKREKPAVYVNFDVFAWGDTLWTAGGTAVATHVSVAASANGIGFVAAEQYPDSDHLSFWDVAWPAITVSLLDRDEIEDAMEAYSGGRPARTPKYARVLHTPEDTMDKLDLTHIPRALRTLEDGLRAWDQGEARAP